MNIWSFRPRGTFSFQQFCLHNGNVNYKGVLIMDYPMGSVPFWSWMPRKAGMEAPHRSIDIRVSLSFSPGLTVVPRAHQAVPGARTEQRQRRRGAVWGWSTARHRCQCSKPRREGRLTVTACKPTDTDARRSSHWKHGSKTPEAD